VNFDVDLSREHAQSFSLEYGFTDVLQIELSIDQQPEVEIDEQAFEIENEVEYELGLLYTLTEQSGVLPHLSIAGSFISEEDEYGYELALLVSYEFYDDHFVHLNLGVEEVDEENINFVNIAYAFQMTEEFALLVEIQRLKEKLTVNNVSSHDDVNEVSFGLVYEIEEGPELGVAYQYYTSDDFLDSALIIKLSYEF